MEIVFASPEDQSDVAVLWRDAFPEDSEQNIRDFMRAVRFPENCLLMRNGTQTVSMVFLLPATLECGDGKRATEALPLQYIYAAATLTAFRAQGLFGRLLRRSLEIARKQGIQASFLRPAEPGLFGYYTRFGYRPFFQTVTERKTRKEFLSAASAVRLPAGNRQGMEQRDSLLSRQKVRVRWPDYLRDYAIDSAAKNGGGWTSVRGGGALCEPDGNRLVIREWLCEPGCAASLKSEVGRRFSFDRVLLSRPALSMTEPGIEPFGMICPLTEKADRLLLKRQDQCPYMGLALD